jgi:glycosyltransferase involved in cell wall biosynthesis
MKILILQDDFPPYVLGGAGIIAHRLGVEYKRLGHEVEVISTTKNRDKDGIVYVDGIKVNVLYSNYHERWRSYVSLYNPRLINMINNILINFGPDVVHAHNIHAHLSYASLKLAKRYSKKVIMTAHDIMPFFPGTFTDYIDKNDLTVKTEFNYKVSSFLLLKKFKLRFNPFRNLFVKYYLSKIDKIIAVSNELKDALSQNGIDNIDVVHNGINLNEWNVDSEKMIQFRNKYNLADKKVILFQGRLSGAKGGDIVLGLMNQIKTNNQVRLLVIGKIDSYASRMLGKAKLLGIEDKVVFTGWLDDSEIKIAYSSSDIVLIPSVCFDSFPNGNLEAFASKKPVIATCFGGSREIVVNNENGYIVNPFDIKLLSERVIGLIDDNEKAKRFGENGYELVKQKFSIETSAKQYLNLFFE